MDNQAMFTAQQMQYNKMYGMDPSRWERKTRIQNIKFHFYIFQKDGRTGSTELTQCPIWTTPVSNCDIFMFAKHDNNTTIPLNWTIL